MPAPWQEWKHCLVDHCEKLPLALDEVSDREKGDQTKQVRLLIAAQWARTLEVARVEGPESVAAQERKKELQAIVCTVLEEFVQVLAFAPEPDLSKVVSPAADDTACNSSASPSSSLASGSPSSCDEAPFDIKFLRAGSDVWTVFQVWV